ncbi:MAG: hypothetical protein IAE94_09025 [Chthoniobacterales bacterium]|nr:hypothetical protein [Chthoniobacterales bacterium]
MATIYKKPIYPIQPGLREYLAKYSRETKLPLTYSDLFYFHVAGPLLDKSGKDTLWQTVGYRSFEMPRIFEALKEIYALLKSGGDRSALEHLYVDRVDYCSFGNTQPFRIRIVNSYNDNQDYFYVKRADASRTYGLELEHLLSPNRMHYLTCGNTLVEEHVAGIPGDLFIKDWLHNPQVKIIRLAKELVKFNERCFIRLLGDMRACNFVMDMTPDVEEVQIRIRAMDFDQQCHNERKKFYFPQFFKDNKPLVLYCMKHLNVQTAMQYQREEQSLILRRMQIIPDRLKMLLDVMVEDELSSEHNVSHLRAELAEHYKDRAFLACETMGSLVRTSLENLLAKHGLSAALPLRLPETESSSEFFL